MGHENDKCAAEISIGKYLTEEEIVRVHAKIMAEYKDVFTSVKRLNTMECKPMHITLHEKATPFALHAASSGSQRGCQDRAG